MHARYEGQDVTDDFAISRQELVRYYKDLRATVNFTDAIDPVFASMTKIPLIAILLFHFIRIFSISNTNCCFFAMMPRQVRKF